MMDALPTVFFVSFFLDMSDTSTGMPVTCLRTLNFPMFKISLSGGTETFIMVCGAEKAQCVSLYQMEFPGTETFLRMCIL